MTYQNNFNAAEASRTLHERYNLHFVDVLLRNGAKVYLFGGSLRDMVMGKDWKDADIRAWLPLPPAERDSRVSRLLKEAGIEVKSVTPFGTAFTVYRFLPKGSKSEVGIDLSVVTDQWLVGPDFTINGLYFDIEKNELIDRYNAVEDIQRKILRTARNPKEQFKEEPYMMFRAVKTACQFGFEIDQNTFQAMKDLRSVAEIVLKMVADREVEGFTEWFLGNIFRGLKYDPVLFQKIWNDVGLTEIFMNFTAKRLGYKPKSDPQPIDIFNTDREYGYEEAISILLSAIARNIDPEHAREAFMKIVELYSILAPKKYEDFLIDTTQIIYFA